MSKTTAVVIGAGASGLATAALISREGYDVTVVERLATYGGRSGEETIDGFRFDTGPSWYLMPDAFDHFFGLFGKRTADLLDLVDLSPAYRVFPEGRAAVDVESGRDNAVRLFDSIEPGAGARLKDYLDSAASVYDMAVERFLYTTFTSLRPFTAREVRSRYLELFRLMSVSLDRFVARRFHDTRLRQILTYPAVFLSSHPARTPSMYHLMSHTDLVQGVRYPQGGFAAVMDAIYSLAAENGATFRFGADVTAISHDGARATGVTLADATEITADLVVSCADLHFTETRLLPTKLRTYDEKWFGARDPGLGTVLLMLGVAGEIPQLAHHNLLFSENWEEDFTAVFDGPTNTRPERFSRSIYISKPSATDPSTAPEGHENLFVLIPTPAAVDIGRGDMYATNASPAVRRITESAIDQIAHWCNIPDLGERILISRSLGPADFAERYHAWSGGSIGPAHTLRQSAFLRGTNRSRKLPNLYYAGASTVPGVGVPMCLISAENVLKRLRHDSTPGPLPEDL
ncbi:phytoene desaturase family protein [Corynebacterium mayonis]|uniref:phytoene desaturase family protein n=1 Tax=Corynebacterium mayonis TaxID=3062461 RepID=UPI0031408787